MIEKGKKDFRQAVGVAFLDVLAWTRVYHWQANLIASLKRSVENGTKKPTGGDADVKVKNITDAIDIFTCYSGSRMSWPRLRHP
jgi:hypothetical protein